MSDVAAGLSVSPVSFVLFGAFMAAMYLLLTAVVAIIMSAVVVAGVHTPNTGVRSRAPYSIEGVALILLYAVASALVFTLGQPAGG